MDTRNQPVTKYANSHRRMSSNKSLRDECTKSKAVSSKKRFPCPLCNGGASRPKDLVRHMTTICDVKEEFRCPDCTKGPFYRRDRFQRHHKKDHPCDEGTCPHADEVRHALRPRDNFGCGICRSYFSEANKYVNHICRHYEQKFGHYWTRSQMVDSLLHQLEVRPLWYELASIRFGSSDSRNWPSLYWDDDTIDHFLPVLERKPSEEWLRRKLPVLLDASSYEDMLTGATGLTHECTRIPHTRHLDIASANSIAHASNLALGLSPATVQYPCYDLYPPRWPHPSIHDAHGLLGLGPTDMSTMAFSSPAIYQPEFELWPQ